MNLNWMQNKSWYGDGLHFLGGYGAVMTGAYFGKPGLVSAGLILYAGFKEFFLDVHFEKNPPQTYWDGVRDFAGYAFGALAASIVLVV